jgi:hypothetical protein
MADVPAKRSRSLTRFGTGPGLLGVGGVLFLVTRVIVWLPLGFVGSWINGFLWPVILLCVLAGGFLTWRGAQGSD